MHSSVDVLNVLKVDIVVYPGFKALEAVGILKVLDCANEILMQRGLRKYHVSIAAIRLGTVPSDTIMSLEATKMLDPDILPDTAIIAGAHNIGSSLFSDYGIVEWVTGVASRIKRLAALCTGVFFLAESGVLNNKRATTHWHSADLLRSRYPAIKVDADSHFIREGTIWTSAGITAGIDLALAMVEDDFGRDVALAVARDLVVYFKRPGEQSQWSLHMASQMTVHPKIRELQAWILAHMSEDLNTSKLAEKMAMSSRNFTRVFQRETSASPSVFIESARLEFARRLVESHHSSLKTIASKTGFGTEERMRRVFQKRLGVTPRDYCERAVDALRPQF
jgi:transcriptional regulator GlxA family with amidase domain